MKRRHLPRIASRCCPPAAAAIRIQLNTGPRRRSRIRNGRLLPTMKIAKPAEWGDRKPVVPQGYAITAIATDLQIPRQTLVLPNGDILVAEGRGGYAPKLTPKDVIAARIKAKGTSPVKGGNRLTLLRDADGDGTYEVKSTFAEDLNAPYGLALIGSSSSSRTRMRWCVSITRMGRPRPVRHRSRSRTCRRR